MERLEQIKKELKRTASIKCRLNKQRGKKTYAEEMAKVLLQEEELKAARDSIIGSKKTVTTYTKEDIEQLSYEEVTKAIKSIQSKKSNTKWLTEVEGDNDEFRQACAIEAMLNERRAELQPTTVTLKSKVSDVLDTADSLSKDELVAAIRALLG